MPEAYVLSTSMPEGRSLTAGATELEVERFGDSRVEEGKVFKPRHAVPKKPASKSPVKKKSRGRMPQPQPLNIDDSSLNASPPKNHVEEPKLHDQFVYVTPPDEDVSNVPIEDLFSTLPCPKVKTELDAICSMVKSETLYTLLDEDMLLDTKVVEVKNMLLDMDVFFWMKMM
ncbi:hypothetical protein MRB53_021640 [Persea americana]|uniref:Uncharacterized protein n=1 Tax=Persea americana TaxID=3435 RepID=A0ACC2L5K7_PERAE|nr:hypothetical protein MRB53_021640 [Persea americana]